MKYPINQVYPSIDAKGYVLRMSIQADWQRSFTSVNCSDSTGNFPDVHWEGNGFMNYLPSEEKVKLTIDGSSLEATLVPNINSQYNGEMVFCPVVEHEGGQYIFVKYSANDKTARKEIRDGNEQTKFSKSLMDPKFYSTATVLGYW